MKLKGDLDRGKDCGSNSSERSYLFIYLSQLIIMCIVLLVCHFFEQLSTLTESLKLLIVPVEEYFTRGTFMNKRTYFQEQLQRILMNHL